MPTLFIQSGDNSEVIVTVTETNNGVSRKIPSQDLTSFFSNQAMQLKNLGVQNVYSKVGSNNIKCIV